jgi:hypothetical protein
VGAGHNAQPDHIHRFLYGRPDNLLNGLVESGINNFHTGIPQCQSGYLGPAIMPIQTGFADQYLYFLCGHIHIPS